MAIQTSQGRIITLPITFAAQRARMGDVRSPQLDSAHTINTHNIYWNNIDGEIGPRADLGSRFGVFKVTDFGADQEVLTKEATDIRHQWLEKQAIRGTVYIVAYYAISLSLRVVSSVVLTRLF